MVRDVGRGIFHTESIYVHRAQSAMWNDLFSIEKLSIMLNVLLSIDASD